MKYKKILLGNDPWSETFKDYIKSLPHYETVMLWKMNLTQGVDIKLTPYYQHYLAVLKADGTIWNGIINTEEELLKMALNFKDMYDKRYNWRHTVPEIQISEDGQWFYGDLPVRIENNGDFYLYDGYHRISILLAYDMPISLTIVKREYEWQRMYEDLDELYSEHSLYQPIDHPDFNDWICDRGDKKEQVLRKIVKEFNIKSVIDCGVCHGFTLYKLRDLIVKGVGLEYNRTRYDATKIVYDKIGFEVRKLNIMDFESRTVDAVFALAVFHHLMRQHSKKDFEGLVKAMVWGGKHLIYSLPEKDEPQFHWMYDNIKYDTREYLICLTGYKNEKVYNVGRRKIVVLY